MIQWYACKYFTTDSRGKEEVWFIVFAHFCGANTLTMAYFKLQHKVICLSTFLKLTVSSQALMSLFSPPSAHQ